MSRTPLPIFTAAWCAGLVAFLVMAVFAGVHNTFPADVWLAHRLQELQSASLDRLLNWTADLATTPLIVVVGLLAIGGFYLTFGRRPALLLVAAFAARGADSLAKLLVDRPRPSSALVHFSSQPGDPSFPSGHANTAALFYGMIVYLAAVYIPDGRVRLPLQALCLWVMIGTAVQRVYAGEHWPSDVAGGLLLGALLVTLLIAADRFVLSRLQAVTTAHPVRS